MRRLSWLATVLAILAALALPACGSASDTARKGAASTSSARAHRGGAGLKRIGSFEAPVYLTGAPGFPKLLFVVEQPGRIAVLRGGRPRPKPFLDLSGRSASGGERGLLSVAFPPDYERSGRFYV